MHAIIKQSHKKINNQGVTVIQLCVSYFFTFEEEDPIGRLAGLSEFRDFLEIKMNRESASQRSRSSS